MAVDLGKQARVVTTVTGAVVLENDQQYVDAGLLDGDPELAPAVPEPHVFGLLLVVVLFLGARWWRQRRRGALA